MKIALTCRELGSEQGKNLQSNIMSIENSFKVKLSNIPLLNLRAEFGHYLLLFNDESFKSKLEENICPKETSLFVWYGDIPSFYTVILQRCITGLESYICGAVFIEGGLNGLLNNDNLKYITNPFNFNNGNTPDRYYNQLPNLINNKFQMKESKGNLWNKTCKFYKEIRNPIFHGKQIESVCLPDFVNILHFVKNIYEWIDTWHDSKHILTPTSLDMRK